ncbi:MAG: phosphodiester glycosidase family protein [Steroidobacteraceae bacterium]
MSLAGALLICSGVSHAVECAAKTAAGGTTFTTCRVNLNIEHLELFWRDDTGQPYRQFLALREAVRVKGKQLVFAVNAGMYLPDFSPVGLFVTEGRELAPLNRHVGSGNFSQQPNGVFLVEGSSARVITTDEYASEHPKPSLATQSGPMLVHNGEITTSAVMSPNSNWRKIRNGVCAPSPAAAVFVISESPVTFYEFAGFFRDTLHCREALYLDGTISSLYAPSLKREDRGSDMGPILGVAESLAGSDR